MRTYSPVSFSVAANSFECAAWRAFDAYPLAFVLMSYWVLLNLIFIKYIPNQIAAVLQLEGAQLAASKVPGVRQTGDKDEGGRCCHHLCGLTVLWYAEASGSLPESLNKPPSYQEPFVQIHQERSSFLHCQLKRKIYWASHMSERCFKLLPPGPAVVPLMTAPHSYPALIQNLWSTWRESTSVSMTHQLCVCVPGFRHCFVLFSETGFHLFQNFLNLDMQLRMILDFRSSCPNAGLQVCRSVSGFSCIGNQGRLHVWQAGSPPTELYFRPRSGCFCCNLYSVKGLPLSLRRNFSKTHFRCNTRSYRDKSERTADLTVS